MRLAASVAGVVLVCAACGGGGGDSSPPPPPPASSAAATPYAEAQRLIADGQADAALAALQSAPAGAESLFLQGVAWAKKAETAPLPTPPPAPAPVPRGYVPQPAPEFKPEELQAISFYDQALAMAPGHARAHEALAEILAPHALRRVERGKAATGGKGRGKRGKAAETPPPAQAADGPDASPERVLREYRAAIEADPTAVKPIEALIAFGARTDRTAEAEWALQELLKREREKPEPHIRYGDYLKGRGDLEGAVAQYRQALIWKADDEATMAKIGDIYISQAEGHLARQEWAAADQRLKDAQKWVKDKQSATGLKLQAAQNQLRQIRR